MDNLELTAPGLVLRPWRDEDAAVVLVELADPEIARWNAQGVTDLPQARAWVRRRADWSSGTHVSLALTDAADGRLLGGASLHQIQDGDAAIGYWTAAAARGRGVASRAVTALTAWGFGELGLHRVQLWHAVDNEASCRVAERSGYRLEGVLRESHRYGDGRRHDEHLHARLATDP
ncbi:MULTISPECIES: GNAT family N-acetyltransferase [Micromonospora]|uniref:N-acetyltransferase n=1 Tax=Micromonospora solifontis TaxID=2487138 RepID=A0ABX9WJD2_9ACTN|nr:MULTISPECIES: GNAT family protein [Micromonospora]NES15452.1 GNAT family N-acetyltransferase [Micromonospora sp. PPF5-17B]NES35802.1 GNAT family N-acetyltransferase [Micromonospora solifontis]NES55638.1 GNAT family N-acetyltransferase [Micromonospora sp. PPF5-6]RNM00280.1 N-acetyltransferase [Micromonospora solifontis]